MRWNRDIDDVMDRFWSSLSRDRLGWGQGAYRQPLADVWETDKEVFATVELPGVNKDDIVIDATENGINIHVESIQQKKNREQGRYSIERRYTGFERYIQTPAGIDPENIKATYKNGVLELRMPKTDSSGTKVQVE